MRMVNAAANRVLRSEIAARARLLAADADAAFAIDAAGDAALARRRGRPSRRRRADADPARRAASPAILSKATPARKSAIGWPRSPVARSSAGWRRCSRFPPCRWAGSGAVSPFSLPMRSAPCRCVRCRARLPQLDPADRAALSRQRRALWHRNSLCRAAAAARRAALSRAALGGSERAGDAGAALGAPARQGHRRRSGFAGLVLSRRSAFSSPTGWRCGRIGWSGSPPRRGGSRGMARSRRTRVLPRSPASSPVFCDGC